MRLIYGLISLPLLALVLCFALANRQDVILSFWPADAQVALPLSILLLGVFVGGVLVGLFWSWCASLGRRIESLRLRRALRILNEDKAVQPPTAPASPSASFSQKLIGVFKK